MSEPDDHPVIPGLLNKQEDIARTAEMVERAESSQWSGDELEILKSEHHICDGCDHSLVCAVNTQPMMQGAKIVIAGCMQYTPKRKEDETDQELSPI